MRYTIKTNQGDVIINDGILSNEEYQAIAAHRDRKNSLGNRVIVLREYIKLSYGDYEELEDLVDHVLKENDYDLEKCIDYYRSIIPAEAKKEVITLCQCGYRKPFCLCIR